MMNGNLVLTENTERVLNWARAQERNETVREIWKALCDRFGVSTTATGEGVLRLLRKAGSPDVADIFRDEPAPYPKVCWYIAEKLRSMIDDAECTEEGILAWEKYVLKRMGISEDDLETLCSAVRDRDRSEANEAGAANMIRYAAVGGVAVAAARMAPEKYADVEDQVAKRVLAGILVAVDISLAELTLIGITVPAYRKAIPGITYVALLRELRAAELAFRASAAKKPLERTRRHPEWKGNRWVCRGPYADRDRGDYHPGIPAGQAATLRNPLDEPAAVS